MNTILQKRIEEAVKKTACPQCVYNDGGTCNNDDDCKLFDDFVGLMTFALQNQWISVEEALPEYEERVLVAHQYGCQVASLYKDNSHQYWGVIKGSPIGADITHWAEIPSLEGGEK